MAAVAAITRSDGVRSHQQRVGNESSLSAAQRGCAQNGGSILESYRPGGRTANCGRNPCNKRNAACESGRVHRRSNIRDGARGLDGECFTINHLYVAGDVLTEVIKFVCTWR